MKKFIYLLALSCSGFSGLLQASDWQSEEDLHSLQETVLTQCPENLDLFMDLVDQKWSAEQIRNMLGIPDSVDSTAPHFSIDSYQTDAELARQLSQEQFAQEEQLAKDFQMALNFQEESQQTFQTQTNSDWELAKKLEEEEKGRRPAPSQFFQSEPSDRNDFFSTPKVAVSEDVRSTLSQAVGSFETFQNGNVHDFNKKFVSVYKGSLYQPLINQLGLKTSTPVQRISETLATQGFGSLRAALAKMNSHALSTADQETGLRVDHLLSCVFDVCQKIESLPHVRIQATPYLIESLNENIDTKGGCHPGYAGRLFRDLLYLTNIYLQNVRVVAPK